MKHITDHLEKEKVDALLSTAKACNIRDYFVLSCLSTIFLQSAKHTPVPGYCSVVCSRWKVVEILSACCMSIPMPLSLMENCHPSAPHRAPRRSELLVVFHFGT